jgi:hypothetical protein
VNSTFMISLLLYPSFY